MVVEKPEGDPTRDEIIDSYIKTLAMVVGRFGIFGFFSLVLGDKFVKLFVSYAILRCCLGCMKFDVKLQG